MYIHNVGPLFKKETVDKTQPIFFIILFHPMRSHKHPGQHVIRWHSQQLVHHHYDAAAGGFVVVVLVGVVVVVVVVVVVDVVVVGS